MIRTMKGTHHVGIGVQNYEVMKEFYAKTLEMKNVWTEFPEVWNAMGDVFRTSQHKFAGIMFGQDTEGVVVELIAMSIPIPRPIRKDTRYGDIGVNKMTIAVSEVGTFYQEHKDQMNFSSAPKMVNLPDWGEYHFVYAKDPEDNLIEFISGPNLEVEDKFGGVRWVGVAVTDLERSTAFYQSYAFDKVVVAPHEEFFGMVDDVSGVEGTQVRSCLLANSNGGGMVELYEVMKPRGRSIPLNVHWGDFGYLELSVECNEIHELASWSRKEGIPFLHNPAIAFEDKQVEFWFDYVYDPDGIPVETIGMIPKGPAGN
jgi:catechol 2,3-dioxygenase-like lactoylglutathione lyase family enzyme